MNVNHVFPWMNPHVVHAGTSLREIIPIVAVPRAAGIAKAVFLTFQAEKHKDGKLTALSVVQTCSNTFTYSLIPIKVENALYLKGNDYWKYTHFSLNHDYGRKGTPWLTSRIFQEGVSC